MSKAITSGPLLYRPLKIWLLWFHPYLHIFSCSLLLTDCLLVCIWSIDIIYLIWKEKKTNMCLYIIILKYETISFSRLKLLLYFRNIRAWMIVLMHASFLLEMSLTVQYNYILMRIENNVRSFLRSLCIPLLLFVYIMFDGTCTSMMSLPISEYRVVNLSRTWTWKDDLSCWKCVTLNRLHTSRMADDPVRIKCLIVKLEIGMGHWSHLH